MEVAVNMSQALSANPSAALAKPALRCNWPRRGGGLGSCTRTGDPADIIDGERERRSSLPADSTPASEEAERAAGLRMAHSLLMLLARSRIETTPTTASASITGRCRYPPESI